MWAGLVGITWDVLSAFTTPDLDRPFVLMDQHEAQFDEQVAHVSREIRRGLVALHEYDARFTSIEQQQSAFRTLCRDVDLLVVLPTGGSGKSLLFELHPTVEANRMTV